jgi:ketosteroid isomerase-like protein
MAGLSFDDFLNLREQAASAYVQGDGARLDAIVPHAGMASFHSPVGETVTGGSEVARRYLGDAAAFHDNGVSHFEVIQKGHAGDLGFWTGFQVANVQIGDMPGPVDMRVRVTEIFRKIEGEWKLIHRHADIPDAN